MLNCLGSKRVWVATIICSLTSKIYFRVWVTTSCPTSLSSVTRAFSATPDNVPIQNYFSPRGAKSYFSRWQLYKFVHTSSLTSSPTSSLTSPTSSPTSPPAPPPLPPPRRSDRGSAIMARRFNSGSVNLKRSTQWVCDALQLNATLHLPDLKFLFAASHFWGEISCDARTCWNLQLTYNWPILAAALSLMMPCWHAERNGAGPPSTMELKWHPLKKTERWQISCKLYQKMESSLFKKIFSNAYSEFLESINIFKKKFCC